MMRRFIETVIVTTFILGCMIEANATEVYVPATNHTYQLIISDCTWNQAFQIAKESGGHLACFETLDEYNQIIEQINKVAMSGIMFRIGGCRNAGSQEYHWIDADNYYFGETLNDTTSWTYPYWMQGEPSFMDGQTTEEYMDMYYYSKEGRWVLNDVPDDIISIVRGYSGKLGFIIEFEDTTTTQTPLSQNTSVSPNDVLAFTPENFLFTSGAGGWGTEMTLNQDGTFTGHYHDSNMGVDNDIYPGGEESYCDFSGEFTDFQKVDDYTYSMRLTSLEYEDTPGEDWTDGHIHYIASDAYGLSGGDLFYLYLPGHPMNTLPESYKGWARNYMYGHEDSTTLPIYGIYNVNEELGWGSR